MIQVFPPNFIYAKLIERKVSKRIKALKNILNM